MDHSGYSCHHLAFYIEDSMIELIARKWREIWLPGKNSLDVLLIVTIFILLFSGLCVMYSSSSISAWREFKDSEYFLKKQAVWICIGLVSFFLLRFSLSKT